MERGELPSDGGKWDVLNGLQIEERKNLVDTLNHNKWIDSSQIDLNCFSVLWRKNIGETLKKCRLYRYSEIRFVLCSCTCSEYKQGSEWD